VGAWGAGLDADACAGDGVRVDLKAVSGRAPEDLGPVWFPREFMCEFMDSGSGVFERELIEAALDYSIAVLDVDGLDGGRRR